MIKKSIIIISNESVSYEKNHFYCDNVDIKSISEELDSKFSILHINAPSSTSLPCGNQIKGLPHAPH